MGLMNTFITFSVIFIVTAIAIPATGSDPHATKLPCATGTPVVTAGYTISYAEVVPTSVAHDHGYQPEATWASSHVVATYTYGTPEPVESGFAYAQFKCQYTCNAAPGASFFVKYAGREVGSYCSCYNELLDPSTFVFGNQTLVGAWNAICGVTHPDMG